MFEKKRYIFKGVLCLRTSGAKHTPFGYCYFPVFFFFFNKEHI